MTRVTLERAVRIAALALLATQAAWSRALAADVQEADQVGAAAAVTPPATPPPADAGQWETQPPPPGPSGAPAQSGQVTQGAERAATPQPVATAPGMPNGQWVYTQQYGWIWMPYATSYTYLPPNGAYPLMYVYYPAYGWTWLDAPWVWGWGPWPWFGAYGGVGFAWYGGASYYHTHYPYYYPPYRGSGYPGWRPNQAPWAPHPMPAGTPWRPAPAAGVRAGPAPAPMRAAPAPVRAAPARGVRR